MIDLYLDDNLDINFNDLGDLVTETNAKSSIIISLFANRDLEIILNNFEGSYIYLLEQSRINTTSINSLKTYTKDALSYLYDLDLVDDIKVDVKVSNNTQLKLLINLINYKLQGDYYEFTI